MTANGRGRDSVMAVLHAVLAQGQTLPTHAALADATGLSTRTITNAVATLREPGYLRTGPLRLGPGLGVVASVALGAETCRGGLVDANGMLYASVEEPPLPFQVGMEPGVLLGRIRTTLAKVLAKAREKHRDLLVDGCLPLIGVATALPGPVRGSMRVAGSVMHSAWLTETRQTLPEAVGLALGCQPEYVHVLNDANAHALAVAFDRTRARAADPKGEEASRIALVMRIGGGIGSSTMIVAPHRAERLSFIDSIMLAGARSLAGELGHIPVERSVVDAINERGRWVDGLAPLSMDWPCSCGQTGHLEALASGTAWKRRMDESGVRIPQLLEGSHRHSVSLTDQALSDLEDQRVTIALEDAGRLIGRTLAGPVLLLDPQWLTLTGSFAVQPVLNGILAERETWRHVFGDALIVESADGPDPKFIGVRGAALAAIRGQVYRKLSSERLRQPLAGADLVTLSEL